MTGKNTETAACRKRDLLDIVETVEEQQQ